MKHCKLKVAQKVEFFLDRVKNIIGKGENAGFPIVFKMLHSQGCLNPVLFGKGLILYHISKLKAIADNKVMVVF